MRSRNLITVVTRFELPAGVTAEQIRDAFEEAAPGFRNGVMEYRSDGVVGAPGGVYSWNDETTARAFLNEYVAAMISEKLLKQLIDGWVSFPHRAEAAVLMRGLWRAHQWVNFT